MELNLELFSDTINEYKALIDKLRAVEPKVKVEDVIETLDDKQRKHFATYEALLMKADLMVHGNFDPKLAQAFDALASKFRADCKAQMDFLITSKRNAAKVIGDKEHEALVLQAREMREKIESLETVLPGVAGIKIPTSFYKKNEDGSLMKTKTGGLRLDIPNAPSAPTGKEDESGPVTRGRPTTASMIILGTVNEKDETEWHDNDHPGKTFATLYGSVRADHNFIGLCKVVEKSDQSTTGWTTPVEYAGRKWVGKMRSK